MLKTHSTRKSGTGRLNYWEKFQFVKKKFQKNHERCEDNGASQSKSFSKFFLSIHSTKSQSIIFIHFPMINYNQQKFLIKKNISTFFLLKLKILSKNHQSVTKKFTLQQINVFMKKIAHFNKITEKNVIIMIINIILMKTGIALLRLRKWLAKEKKKIYWRFLLFPFLYSIWSVMG